MNHYEFAPNITQLGSFDGFADNEDLEKEVGVFASDLDFVRAHCGPLALRFLDAVPATYHAFADASGLVANCDIRLHYLQVGQYPASPGWHCDAAIRETVFDATAPTVPVSNNLIATISSSKEGVSNTEFSLAELSIDSEHVYGNDPLLWEEVDARYAAAPPRTLSTKDGILYGFDGYSLHRAAAAKASGWRLFFRMSLWHPPTGHVPGVSSSEQIYNLVR